MQKHTNTKYIKATQTKTQNKHEKLDRQKILRIVSDIYKQHYIC